MLSFGNTLCAAQRLARPKSSFPFYEKLYTYVSPRVSACIACTVYAGAIPNQVGTSRWGILPSLIKIGLRYLPQWCRHQSPPSPNVPMGLCFVVDAGAARSMMRGLQPDDYRSHKIDKNQLYFFLFKAVGFIKDKKSKS